MTTEEFRNYPLKYVRFANDPEKERAVYDAGNIIFAVNVGGEEIMKFESCEGVNLAYLDPAVCPAKYPILCEKNNAWFSKRGTIEDIRAQIANGCRRWEPAREFLAPIYTNQTWSGEWEYVAPSEERVAIRRALHVLSRFRIKKRLS